MLRVAETIRVRAARAFFAACLLGFALSAIPAEAQIIHGQKARLNQGLTYLTWDFSGDEDFTIAQWFLPVSVNTPLRENFELALSSGATRSDADWTAAGDDISGMVDSRVQVAGSFLDDQIIVSVGLSLPTGQTKLTNIQQNLLGFLTSDFLNFPVKNPGEGLNIFGELGFATPIGQWVFGAAGAVLIPGEYDPYEATLTYQPGTRIIGTLGLERFWSGRNFISADIVLVSSAEDKADDEVIFRDGTQFDLRLTGSVGGRAVSVDAGMRYIVRGKDRRPREADAKLVAEARNHNGNDLRVRLSPRVTLNEKVSIWASVEAKILSANEYDETDALFEDAARIHGGGGGVDLRLSPRSVIRLGVRVWTGSSDGAFGIGPFDLTGYEIIERLTITL